MPILSARRKACFILSGFTLIELLVVIAIIGILIALLLPAVHSAREAGRRTQCVSNFKQVGLALMNHHAAKKKFPPGSYDPVTSPGVPVYWGWSVYILPYIEQQAVYDQFDMRVPENYFTTEANRVANATRISTYLCPSDPVDGELVSSSSLPWPGHPPLEDSAPTDMCGVADSVSETSAGTQMRQYPDVDGIFGTNGCCVIKDIRDGTSKTLMVGEVTGAGPGTNLGHFWASDNTLGTRDGINGPFTAVGGTYPPWSPPSQYGLYSAGFASFHPGGCNFLFADGSVTFIMQDVPSGVSPAGQPPTLLQALTTRSGSEVVQVP